MSIAVGIVLVTIVWGIPVAFGLGIGAATFLLIGGIPLELVTQRMFTGLDSFPLMAVPFFILAGELMNSCGITRKIVRFADAMVGNFRGGLAQVNIVSCMFFAGVSGSAVADASAVGSMLIPAMRERGFDHDFSAAVTASAAVMGPIIPPSIPMVVYAMLSNTSVAAMLLAGAIPGVLLGVSLMLVAYYISVKRKYSKNERFPSLREFLSAFAGAMVPMMMPLIILGGILAGIFTATESAAVAVGYAIIIGIFVYRSLKLEDIIRIALSTAKTTGIVFLVMATANVFNWLMATEQVSQHAAVFVAHYFHNPISVLFIINVLLLILGCFMEGTAAMILTVPIILEITNKFGLNPVFVGIVVVLNLMIGLITPPLGLCLYVTCGVSNISLERLSRAIIPFLIAELVVLLFVTYIPAISLALPKMFRYL